MTRERMSSREETPFGAWLRACPGLESHTKSLTVTDVDWMLHKYRTHVDGVGTRSVHCTMFLEVKCYSAVPTPSQLETLFIHHRLLRRTARLSVVNMHLPGKGKVKVLPFGVHVLSLPGTSPNDSATFRWGGFLEDGRLTWRSNIAIDMLPYILGFDVRPDTFNELDLRRHHKTQILECQETAPLKFVVDTLITHRS